MIKRSLILMVCATLIFMLLPVTAEAAAQDSKAGAVTISNGYLNVRSSASAGSSKVTTLSKGSYITLISKSGDWWRVEYVKGKFGYCHADYITIVAGTPVTVKTQSGNLNVRSGAGTSYTKTGSLARGETVILLSQSGGWSRILYHGTKTGYVSSQYLSNYFGAVSLSVPNFKQTDSRWSGVEIAQSGKTMAQIGCATTAIAMMESYRTGTTIYPDAMTEMLQYTPSGNVYWPADYVTVTESAGYLAAIYQKLQQGRPVLFGARNAYGKQHWVVIRGFVGNSTLTPSGFTILDPGSNSRTNLQQFLDAYPTFYKYFYYG